MSAAPDTLRNPHSVVVAVDPHKASWTAVAVTAGLAPADAIRVEVNRAGYRRGQIQRQPVQACCDGSASTIADWDGRPNQVRLLRQLGGRSGAEVGSTFCLRRRPETRAYQ